MPDWNAPTAGLYCERSDASFWAEPTNALSNAAFLIAAAVLVVRRRDDAIALALAAMVAAIGIGSFLFHTVATRWAMIADVAPIQLFIAVYFFLALRRFLGLQALAGAAVTIVFMAVASALPQLFPPGPGRGFGGYLGGLLGMLVMGLPLWRRRDPRLRRAGRGLLASAALFAGSLLFRTVDGLVCPYVATGTHPLWHLLNAVVLFVLVGTFAAARPTPPAKA